MFWIKTVWQKWLLFYHKLGSPKLFYQLSHKFIPWFALPAIFLFLIGALLGLFVAPTDYQQGDAYRIMYMHVPAAWMSLFVYLMMAIAAVVGFVWRIKTAFMVCICAAPIGAAFTFIALATGSIWGKPMWGTWWEWDARLTSELILLFLYLGIITLYNAFENKKSAEKAVAILSIVGAVNIPIIHYSVVWWNSLHQTSSVMKSGGPAMPASMLLPLMLIAFAFKFLFAWLLTLRLQNHIVENHLQSQWLKQLFQEGDK
jgi:heme exporter protein C